MSSTCGMFSICCGSRGRRQQHDQAEAAVVGVPFRIEVRVRAVGPVRPPRARAGLLVPVAVLRDDQAELAERLAVAEGRLGRAGRPRGDDLGPGRVGAERERDVVERLDDVLVHVVDDRRAAVALPRIDVGVEVVLPVDQPVGDGVRDQDVVAGAAEGDVGVRQAGAARIDGVVRVRVVARLQRLREPDQRRRLVRGEDAVDVARDLLDPLVEVVRRVVPAVVLVVPLDAAELAAQVVRLARARRELADEAAEARVRDRRLDVRRVEVVVGLEQVVAVAAEQEVLVGAADEPVVAAVAEQDVLAVVDHRLRGRRVERRRRDEVEEEVDPGRDVDLLERVALVVVPEQARARVVAERVAGRVVRRQRGEDAERVAAVVVVERERLGAGHRVVAAAAVHEVVAEAAVHDVVAAGVERLLDRGVVELPGDVDRDVDVVGVGVAGVQRQLRRRGDPEQRLGDRVREPARAGRRRRACRRRRCRPTIQSLPELPYSWSSWPSPKIVSAPVSP